MAKFSASPSRRMCLVGAAAAVGLLMVSGFWKSTNQMSYQRETLKHSVAVKSRTLHKEVGLERNYEASWVSNENTYSRSAASVVVANPSTNDGAVDSPATTHVPNNKTNKANVAAKSKSLPKAIEVDSPATTLVPKNEPKKTNGTGKSKSLPKANDVDLELTAVSRVDPPATIQGPKNEFKKINAAAKSKSLRKANKVDLELTAASRVDSPATKQVPNDKTNKTKAVRIDINSPVIKAQDNLPKFKFFIIEVPFLTTDLLASPANRTRAKKFYGNRGTLNEDIGEMWIYRGFKRMTFEEGRTHDPAQADIFLIAGLNNLRFSIYKWDFPRKKELDDILRPYIYNSSKPHVLATPRVRNRIGLNHMADSLRRLGVNLHSLGYERSPGWQSVPADRIITVPYVVKPSESREELQKNVQAVPRKEGFTFYAGDTRPDAHAFGGCNRTNLTQFVPQDRDDMFIRLFANKRDRISQEDYNNRMQTSDYCLVMCGDTPTSRALASTMVAGCIPIFIGSRWRGYCEPPCHSGWGWTITNGLSHLPYPQQLEWAAFPEINEEAFAMDPVGALDTIFERQTLQRRKDIRKAMTDMQLHWVYGWDNPVDSEEFGEAVPTIWKSVVDHLWKLGAVSQPISSSSPQLPARLTTTDSTTPNPTLPPTGVLPPSSCEINRNMTDVLSRIPIGWDAESGPPSWIKVMCPDVVEHFSKFPSFKENSKFINTPLPIQTTAYAAQSVCTIKVVQHIAASINARAYLHAGSHLGAILHGQPIPWDDDVDMIMDYRKKNEFLDACTSLGEHMLTDPIPVKLQCLLDFNALKVWLQFEGMAKQTKAGKKHYSPFVDLFLFKIDNGKLLEVATTGKKQGRNGQAYNLVDYFPTRPFYFGGITVLGPASRIAERRYKFENCVVAGWNHRFERGHLHYKINRCVDCQTLSKVLPFVHDNAFIQVGQQTQSIFPAIGTQRLTNVTTTTIKQRRQWHDAPDTLGQNLTDALPQLNIVEIDNSIAPKAECSGKRLRVVEFNAERGKRWLESATLLKDADVIILNEMDIGMARTDQQHTTRLLAHHLQMNYAWGLEFVELTLGDQGDREHIQESTEQNFQGLHGNAILTKCQISDATIFRDGVGQYFSKKKNGVNAKGKERRLGGRMILLARIVVEGMLVAIGSIHKLGGSKSQIIEYIGSSPAIIAGDQPHSFCKKVGLSDITSAGIRTWPASCTGFGRTGGDIICSNLNSVKEAYAVKPCVSYYGFNIQLGDHALVWSELELPTRGPGN